MNLPLIAFPPILDTSSNDIIKDFFNPALGASVRYERELGLLALIEKVMGKSSIAVGIPEEVDED